MCENWAAYVRVGQKMVTDAMGGWTAEGDQSKRMAEVNGDLRRLRGQHHRSIQGQSGQGAQGCVPSDLVYLRTEPPPASLGNLFPCLRSSQMALEEKPWHCCCWHVVPRSLAGSELVGKDEAGPAQDGEKSSLYIDPPHLHDPE